MSASMRKCWRITGPACRSPGHCFVALQGLLARWTGEESHQVAAVDGHCARDGRVCDRKANGRGETRLTLRGVHWRAEFVLLKEVRAVLGH